MVTVAVTGRGQRKFSRHVAAEGVRVRVRLRSELGLGLLRIIRVTRVESAD